MDKAVVVKHVMEHSTDICMLCTPWKQSPKHDGSHAGMNSVWHHDKGVLEEPLTANQTSHWQ